MNALRDDARKTTLAWLLSIALHAGLLLSLALLAVSPPVVTTLEPFPLYLGPIGPPGGAGAASGLGAPAAGGGAAPPRAPETVPVVEPVPVDSPPLELEREPRPKPPAVTRKPDSPTRVDRPTSARDSATGESREDGAGNGTGTGSSGGVPGGQGGGGGGAGGTAAYEQVLAAWLDSHKYYPSALRRRGIEGDGKLEIRITRAGRVLDVEVVRRFSHPSLEPIAQDWVKRSEPFPPVPPSIPGDTYVFAVPVVFRLE